MQGVLSTELTLKTNIIRKGVLLHRVDFTDIPRFHDYS